MPSDPMANAKRRVWTHAGLIAAAAAAAYADSFGGDFQFDDFPAIRDNATVLRLWPLTAALRPPRGALTVSGRPILNLSLAVNHAISGWNLWSYHALNLLIHLGAALALYGIVRRSRRVGAAAGESDAARDRFAAAVAGIWAVHPLTTEAVTYIVQRGESLMGLFYLLTLYCFVRSAAVPLRGAMADEKAAARNSRLWLGLSCLSCLLGVGTKEVIVSAPIVVLLYDRIFVARGWRAAWRRRRAYYLCLAGTWIPLAALVLANGGNRGGTSGFNLGMAASRYWFSQIEALTRYVGLAFWPHPLVFEYGPPTFPFWLSAFVLGPAWLALAVATIVGIVRGRAWAFCVAVCGLVLAPTSVMPGTIQFAVEYRMYLPLAAIVALAAAGVETALALKPARERSAGWARTAIVLILALAAASARRNYAYRSDLALWSDSVAKRPGSAKAQANLGMALSTRGRTAEAIAHYQEALRLNSGLAETYYDLGLAYESEDRYQEALAQFVTAAARDPTLVYAQSHAGRLLDRLGRPAEAEPYLRRAIARDANLASAHGSLGVALVAQGRIPEGIAEYRASLRLEPAQSEVEFDLGLALAATGRVAEAAAHYAAAVRLDPKDADAQLNLGVTLFQLGRESEALPPLAEAARLRPESAAAHGNFATALEQAGRLAEALPEFRRALQLRPDYPEAHYNLGNALLRSRDLAAARAEFAEAVRLNPNFAAAREMLARLSRFPGP